MFGSDSIHIHVGAMDQDMLISRTDLAVLIDSGIVYPKSKSVLKKKIQEAQIVIDFYCIEEKCSYASVLKEILHGPKAGELKALGVQELTKEIVTVIEKNPSIFLSSSLNGYVFQAVGKPYLFLHNNSDPGPGDDARCGFLDLSDVKKRLIFEAMRKKESWGRTEEIAVGALIGSAVVQSASWLLKMRKT